MIVVDSSVWIANLRDLDIDAVRKLRSIDDPGEIMVGDLILLEVLQGARDERHAARIEQNLRQFRIERMFDDDLAVKAARHYRALRREGVTIRKTIDMIIATFCLERGHALLRDDRDFDPMISRLGLKLF
ncbi:MAG: PIN domain nuclease [Hyphomicrobiales bacterium]